MILLKGGYRFVVLLTLDKMVVGVVYAALRRLLLDPTFEADLHAMLVLDVKNSGIES